MRKVYLILSISTALALQSSCAVPIKDEQFCADMGSQGAACDNLLTSNPIIIPQPAWDSMREGMFCESNQAVGDIKAEIESLCSKTPCSYQVKEALHSIQKKMKEMTNDIQRGRFETN